MAKVASTRLLNTAAICVVVSSCGAHLGTGAFLMALKMRRSLTLACPVHKVYQHNAWRVCRLLQAFQFRGIMLA